MIGLVLFLFPFIFLDSLIVHVHGSFDPFMDNHPYSIIWGGPIYLNKEETDLLGDRHILVTTNKDERYQCILPQAKTEKRIGEDQYTGPTATQLLKPLLTQKECSYRIESYWTYELCHGKHLKQYHETREPGTQPSVQEYYLGFGNHRKEEEERKQNSENKADQGKSPSLPVKELEGEEMPYYEVIMSDGTKCDLTDRPRKAHVLYVCYMEGRGEVYEFKEISTCEYEVVVLTALLCKHPDYKPKQKDVSEIRCHAFLGSPTKPSQLISMENKRRYSEGVGQEFSILGAQNEVPEKPTSKESSVPEAKVMFHRKDPKKPEATPPPPPSPTLGAVTDKQTLRDFFSGSKCLSGGHGWWKHEICFGKHAKQFHQEENGKMTNIFLGFWVKHSHMKWLQENPLKRPKDLQFRKHVSHHYSNGDICDLSGKPRTCEVRLKCVENSKNPHAVMLSLAEPSPCQYVLTVDSALFCPILKNANSDDGLFEHVDL